MLLTDSLNDLLGHCAWRKLGDVVASIFALGLHEDVDGNPDVPAFLCDLRKTVFARVYSGDKNVSIFLGRPPRMSKKFAFFQIPHSRPNLGSNRAMQNDLNEVWTWYPSSEMSYTAETRWSALCASLKEEILDLLYSKHRQECEAIEQVLG